MMCIKFFDFNIKHISERKYNAADDFLQKSKNSSLNKETDIIDDFIDLQLNNIQICLIFMKKLEEFAVLKNNYSEESIRIAVFFISLQ